MQDYFNQLSDTLQGMLRGEEVFTCSFSAEDSDFVRFNKAEVRQAGTVHQKRLGVDLIEGSRHAEGGITLSGDRGEDERRLRRLVNDLRAQRAVLGEDPHLLYATDVQSSERVAANELPDGRAAIDDIQEAANGRDLVGIYAAGGIHEGFSNSLGQRNWYTNHTFNFDWSFHHAADKAVKSSFAGFRWDDDAFRGKVDLAGEQLDVLAHAPRTIEPGRYRVYLAPAAMADMIDMIGSDSFGLKAFKTKRSPLLKMFEHEKQLHPALSIAELTAEGLAPNFQADGFIRPDRVTLVEGGQPGDHLVSPRSAREYGVTTNGATDAEAPLSVQIGPGDLPADAVLRELGTGVWIGNVWYLNYSDRNNCRTTGLTRFATFWVEGGQIVAPLNVMRFDETAYRALGENLVGLTAEREWILDPMTYHCRSTRSARLPGALVDDFTFTL